MIDNIVALGYGVVVLGILIGVGSVVLYNFGTTNTCTGTFDYWNATASKCQNASGSQITNGNPLYTNTNSVLTQLGTSGLTGWLPAIIAISVGLLFLGFFAVGKGKKY